LNNLLATVFLGELEFLKVDVDGLGEGLGTSLGWNLLRNNLCRCSL